MSLLELFGAVDEFLQTTMEITLCSQQSLNSSASIIALESENKSQTGRIIQ